MPILGGEFIEVFYLPKIGVSSDRVEAALRKALHAKVDRITRLQEYHGELDGDIDYSKPTITLRGRYKGLHVNLPKRIVEAKESPPSTVVERKRNYAIHVKQTLLDSGLVSKVRKSRYMFS